MKIVTHLIIITILIVFFAMESFSQGDKKHIREGNNHFEKSEYENSEVSYRKALEEESNSFKALFNLGDALYKQEKFDDAAGEFNTLSQTGNDRRSRANSFHNLGNSLLKANKIEESIEAYKNSLRNYPDDPETKYNLAYAQDLLKKQQEQQQQQQDKDKDKENQDEQDKEQQQNKDQQENKEEQQKNQQKGDNQDQQKQEQQPQKISKEDAERLLEAMALDEKELQEKLKKQAARSKKIVTKKNW